jgi:hypothetical protein
MASQTKDSKEKTPQQANSNAKGGAEDDKPEAQMPNIDTPEEIYEKVRELFIQYGFKVPDREPDPNIEEEEIAKTIPELQQPAPIPPSGPLTEEQIKRNAERKFSRMARQVELMFNPPGQELYLTNPIFRQKFDEVDAVFQEIERSEKREPVSLVQVMFPFRNLEREVIDEFLATLKKEIEIEARDPEKYARENPLPPKNDAGQYIIP